MNGKFVVVESTLHETLGVFGPATVEEAKNLFSKLVKEYNDSALNVNETGTLAQNESYRIEIIALSNM